MAKKPKNRLLLILMSTSLVLLLAFQWIWLNQRYEHEERRLYRVLNYNFYKSIQVEQDSLLNKIILKPLIASLPDSVDKVNFLASTQSFERNIRSVQPTYVAKGDSLSLPRNGSTQQERVQVKFIRPEEEDNPLPGRFMRSIAYTLRGINATEPHLVDFGRDSIRIKALDSTYSVMLEEDEVLLPYQIFRLSGTDTLLKKEEGYYTRPMRGDIPIDTRYIAYFPSFQQWVWTQLSPLILFSIFLFLITTGSFWMVYRSLIRQQRLTEMKNSFISNVTHELQTPITTVAVALEALSDPSILKEPTVSKEYLEISKNELKRLSMLVDKVLKMAMFEQEQLQINPEPLDLKELVGSILSTMKLRFDQVKAVVKQDFIGKDFTVSADKVHISSVFYNLLDNALKYAGSQPNIEVKLEDKRDGLELSISDNGKGIPNTYQKRVFEKFFRIPTGDLHQVKGHGLGLSYVATIMQQHGGTVSVDSIPGQGCIFKVNIPR